MMKSIAVIGGGAKAAALSARLAVVRDLKLINDLPTLDIYEKDHFGAAWSGDVDFTSGFLSLCTPGEKDAGFPYDETDIRPGYSAPIAPELLKRFSWTAYLIGTATYSMWVDRGRPFPSHREWARYLQWVFAQAGQSFVQDEVKEIRPERNRWTVIGKSTPPKSYDGVVITGTGRPHTIALEPGIPRNRVFDAQSFWTSRDKINLADDMTIAVAGSGGAAAAIIAWLAEKYLERDVRIVGVNSMGALFPRGDGFPERQLFSDPSDWREESMEFRRRFIKRTEAGVVSRRLKDLVDSSQRVHFTRGRALGARWDSGLLVISTETVDGSLSSCEAHYLVNAIGFDSWSLLEMVQHPARHALLGSDGETRRRLVEEQVLQDLSLPLSSGLPPGLHVPALSGVAQGPGMSNLGSLGLMARAVLKDYLL